MMGITETNSYSFNNIWEKKNLIPGNEHEIEPNGVIFLKYTEN